MRRLKLVVKIVVVVAVLWLVVGPTFRAARRVRAAAARGKAAVTRMVDGQPARRKGGRR